MAPSRVLDSTPVDFTYGTLFGGLDLCTVAWPNATKLFSCDPLNTRKVAPGRTMGAHDYANFHRVNWDKVLRQGNPDLLVVCQPPEDKLRQAWMDTFLQEDRKPAGLLVVDTCEWLTNSDGVSYKRWTRSLEEAGYEITTWCARAEECGAAMWDGHLVTYCRLKGHPISRTKLPAHLGADPGPRSCANALCFTGIGRHAWAPRDKLQRQNHPRFTNYKGRLNGQPVFNTSGPAHCSNESLIQTEKGCRKVLTEEWFRLKGVPSSWAPLARCRAAVMQRPGVHVWSVLGEVMGQCFQGKSMDITCPPPRSPLRAPPPAAKARVGEPDDDAEEADTLAWKWTPPDLSEGSEWYNDRVRGLRNAIAGRTDAAELFREGLQLLAHHRTNYGPEGPKYLVVLWWEWPPSPLGGVAHGGLHELHGRSHPWPPPQQ